MKFPYVKISFGGCIKIWPLEEVQEMVFFEFNEEDILYLTDEELEKMLNSLV